MTIGKENYSVVYDAPFDQRFGRLGRNCILNTGLVQKIKIRCTKLHFDIPGNLCWTQEFQKSQVENGIKTYLGGNFY